MIGNIVICTSLPRTGTVSFCRMLQELGYKTNHAPLSKIHDQAKEGTGFADTPSFVPSVVEWFSNTDLPVKFVYIDRDFDSWFDSMTKSTNLLRTYSRLRNAPPSVLRPGQDEDMRYYGEVFGSFDFEWDGLRDYIEEKFNEHRELMLSEKYSPLVYKFNEGWEPLCNFLGLNIPDAPIPHLHKQSIGTKK